MRRRWAWAALPPQSGPPAAPLLAAKSETPVQLTLQPPAALSLQHGHGLRDAGRDPTPLSRPAGVGWGGAACGLRPAPPLTRVRTAKCGASVRLSPRGMRATRVSS